MNRDSSATRKARKLTSVTFDCSPSGFRAGAEMRDAERHLGAMLLRYGLVRSGAETNSEPTGRVCPRQGLDGFGSAHSMAPAVQVSGLSPRETENRDGAVC
jgi:hypothetical protein